MGSTIRARDVMRRAATLLNDRNFKRWTHVEILGWINDGLREIVARKPDACAHPQRVGLIAGTAQAIPNDAVSLLRVIRNANGGAITPVDREVMDAVNPGWHNPNVVTATRRVAHVIYDEADTRRYFVYPPNDGGGRIEIVVSRYPEPVPVPANRNLTESYSARLDIEDIYANALVEYVLYRCYDKDAQTPAAAARSEVHWQRFINALGGKAASEAQNPNART